MDIETRTFSQTNTRSKKQTYILDINNEQLNPTQIIINRYSSQIKSETTIGHCALGTKQYQFITTT